MRDCRRCDGEKLVGFFGMGVACPRCAGSGIDPHPYEDYEVPVAWTNQGRQTKVIPGLPRPPP